MFKLLFILVGVAVAVALTQCDIIDNFNQYTNSTVKPIKPANQKAVEELMLLSKIKLVRGELVKYMYEMISFMIENPGGKGFVSWVSEAGSPTLKIIFEKMDFYIELVETAKNVFKSGLTYEEFQMLPMEKKIEILEKKI
jgi:hypothetical protein